MKLIINEIDYNKKVLAKTIAKHHWTRRDLPEWVRPYIKNVEEALISFQPPVQTKDVQTKDVQTKEEIPVKEPKSKKKTVGKKTTVKKTQKGKKVSQKCKLKRY